MQSIIYSLRRTLSFDNFPVLTVLANIFLGLALGKILVTPGDELGGSLLIKALMTIGACLFANYLMCLRKAFKGISRNTNGRLRPLLRDAILCAALNTGVFLLSVTLFCVKPHIS